MTKNLLKNRIARVRGLKLVDPWGDTALVGWLDGDSVWLIYEGLAPAFERSLDSMVLAAQGFFFADRSDQFTKTMIGANGVTATLHFEPYWVSTGVPSLATATPTIESLRAKRGRGKSRR